MLLEALPDSLPLDPAWARVVGRHTRLLEGSACQPPEPCSATQPGAGTAVEWLVVGGGVHGVHIATRLLGEAGVRCEQLRIVDPGETLLERWRACTATTGMTHLRSPSVHNLGLDPMALRQYANNTDQTGLMDRFYCERRETSYEIPRIELFNQHCDELIETFRLDQLHLRAWATGCTVGCDSVTVRLSTGETVAAQHLVLAIGSSEQPEWPAWAPRNKERVSHVFETDGGAWPSGKEAVAVVGGGISAGQVCLRLAREGHTVHLLSRHALREHRFDSDPGWMGRLMPGFRQQSTERRRALIKEARHTGSMPPEVLSALREAIRTGQVHWHESGVEALDETGAELTIHLSTGGSVAVQRVLLATGFSQTRPGGEFVDGLISNAKLPCAGCGYPIVDEALRWHPRIHVSGPLAELELGPISRNIVGARQAGDRLLSTLDAVKNNALARAPYFWK